MEPVKVEEKEESSDEGMGVVSAEESGLVSAAKLGTASAEEWEATTEPEMVKRMALE